eukprot:TRINITY_DN32268_c0_g1_i1.p1 TRINITY_DN32268_c0_g1~~TRINITY_DN32268_c0_g1_i1.p1  ORF type:complete len:121 (+),score=18.03 TRINITY_DN32268_c0_g1_i1:34-363(+)
MSGEGALLLFVLHGCSLRKAREHSQRRNQRMAASVFFKNKVIDGQTRKKHQHIYIAMFIFRHVSGPLAPLSTPHSFPCAILISVFASLHRTMLQCPWPRRWNKAAASVS